MQEPSLNIGEQANIYIEKVYTNLLHYTHEVVFQLQPYIENNLAFSFLLLLFLITFLTFEVSKALQCKALFWQYRAFWGRASVIYKGKETQKERGEGQEKVKAKNHSQPCQGTSTLGWERKNWKSKYNKRTQGASCSYLYRGL